jgi:hypothetical protein
MLLDKIHYLDMIISFDQEILLKFKEESKLITIISKMKISFTKTIYCNNNKLINKIQIVLQ